MREIRLSGSVRGAISDDRPYRDQAGCRGDVHVAIVLALTGSFRPQNRIAPRVPLRGGLATSTTAGLEASATI